MITPLGDRVVAERIDTEDATTSSGLIITESAQEKTRTAKVLAVGPGGREDGIVYPVAVSIGDIVIFGRHAGLEAIHDGRVLVILRESEIVGKLD